MKVQNLENEPSDFYCLNKETKGDPGQMSYVPPLIVNAFLIDNLGNWSSYAKTSKCQKR